MTKLISQDHHKTTDPITSNHHNEDAANEDSSECNSEDYLDCGSNENETDAKEDYLEQNTVSCEQLSADHEYSELQ